MKTEKTNDLGVSGGGTLSSQDAENPARTSSVNALDRWLAAKLLAFIGDPRIAIRLWNGDAVQINTETPVASFLVRSRAALHSLLRSPSVGFGDAYSAGAIDVPGDLADFLAEVYRGLIRVRSNRLQRFFKLWPTDTRTRENTEGRAKENIHHHYDLGNEFYQLWLDEKMVYTCAYFERPDMTLEQAQVAKLDHVCRKLDLKPGQSVVEAGCGWGSLALHMAQHYGVTVRAYNISHQQVSYATEQAKRLGLSDRVEFVEDDYRNIQGLWDAFVSVGMLEHVGIERYEQLGRVVQRCLKPSGKALIHTIGRARPAPNNAWIEKRIFPGSYPPSLAEVSAIFEPFEFSILDVENLRLHYRETCRLWLQRFESAAEQVARMYDDEFVRAWRLYLAGSTAAFEVGTLQLFQVLFVQPGNNDVPWTRRALYDH